MNVLVTWGMFKGQKGKIVKTWGKKNVVVKLESGIEFDASVDHVEEANEVKTMPARMNSGKSVHIAKEHPTKKGHFIIHCGAGGNRRQIVKPAHNEEITCKKCLERGL